MDTSGDKHVTKAEGEHSAAFVEAYSLLQAAAHDQPKADFAKSGTSDRLMLSRREEEFYAHRNEIHGSAVAAVPIFFKEHKLDSKPHAAALPTLSIEHMPHLKK